jgi:hypothetical protein
MVLCSGRERHLKSLQSGCGRLSPLQESTQEPMRNAEGAPAREHVNARGTSHQRDATVLPCALGCTRGPRAAREGAGELLVRKVAPRVKRLSESNDTTDSQRAWEARGCVWVLVGYAEWRSCSKRTSGVLCTRRRYSALPLRRDFLEPLHQLKSGPRPFKNVPRSGLEVRMGDLCWLIQITSLIPMCTHENPWILMDLTT